MFESNLKSLGLSHFQKIRFLKSTFAILPIYKANRKLKYLENKRYKYNEYHFWHCETFFGVFQTLSLFDLIHVSSGTSFVVKILHTARLKFKFKILSGPQN